MTMETKYAMTDNTAEQRFEFDIEGSTALIEYVCEEPDIIILTYTYVPAKLGGRGIGKEIVQTVLEHIRKEGKKVVPQCSFIAQYICDHTEWEDIVLKKAPQQ